MMIDGNGTFDAQMKTSIGVAKTMYMPFPLRSMALVKILEEALVTPFVFFIWLSKVPLTSIIMPRSLGLLDRIALELQRL